MASNRFSNARDLRMRELQTTDGGRFFRTCSHACSRMTSSAFLSMRSPRKAGCRISPSLVHSVNFTSLTSFGISQVVAVSCFTF